MAYPFSEGYWQGLMPARARKRRWASGGLPSFGNIEPAPLEYPDDDSVNSFERRFPGATSDDPIYRSFVRALDLGGSPDANLARWGDVRGGVPIPRSSTYGVSQNASAGSATKKKGLSLKNMINAMSKMKAPTGMDFGKAGGRVGGSRPTAPSPRALGVDALQMASADDPRKKWWKQWQGLMGA